MADCFTMPNAAELVEELKNRADCAGGYCTEACGESLFKIADFVEALMQENAKLKAERDAYVQLFSKTDVWKCPFCAHNRQPYRMAFADCDVAGECKNTDALPTHFELRGVQKEEE